MKHKTVRLKFHLNKKSLDYETNLKLRNYIDDVLNPKPYLCVQGLNRFFEIVPGPGGDSLIAQAHLIPESLEVVLTTKRPKGHPLKNNWIALYPFVLDNGTQKLWADVRTKSGRKLITTSLGWDNMMNHTFHDYDVVYGWVEI